MSCESFRFTPKKLSYAISLLVNETENLLHTKHLQNILIWKPVTTDRITEALKGNCVPRISHEWVLRCSDEHSAKQRFINRYIISDQVRIYQTHC